MVEKQCPASTEVFVHIGMHKAASTYIQTQIFDPLAKKNRILYADPYFHLGIPDVNSSVVVQKIDEVLQRVPYYKIDERFCAEVDKQLTELALSIGIAKPKFLLSNEYLVGAERHNFFMDVNPLLAVRNTFKNAKILLIIRRQDEFLESWYANQIRYGRWEPLHQVLNLWGGKFGRWKPSYRLNLDVAELDYYSFVQHLDEMFGRENVTVIPFEQLRHDPESFRNSILAYLGEQISITASTQPINKKYPYVTLVLTRLINRFVNNGTNGCVLLLQRPLNVFLRRYSMRPYNERPSWVNKALHFSNNMSWVNLLYLVGKLLPIKGRFISAELAEEIMELHQDGNRRLAEYRGLPLDLYGYY